MVATKFNKFLLFFLIILTNHVYSAVVLNTIGNTVTLQTTIFRSNVNPYFDFLTGGSASTVTSIVFQMNSTSNGPGYPASIANTVQLQISSGATVIATFTYSSYDAATKRVTLTGSAALSANTSYKLTLGCTTCANVGFDQTTTNATGWSFTSDYFGTGYPIVSFSTGANNAPVLGSIGNQTGTVGTAVNLTISATDSDNDTLSYSATGLPTGLSINSSTGTISGTPTASGTFNTTVTVSDGNSGQDSESFTWTISAQSNTSGSDRINNTDVDNIIRSQNSLSARVASENTTPIKNRLHSLLVAPQNTNSNISNQGVRLSLNFNPVANQLINMSGILNNLNLSGDLFRNGWAVWSAGEVIIGDGKNGAEYNINSITLGTDKRLTRELITGVSFRIGKDENDLDRSTSFDSNFYSGSLYGSYAVDPISYVQGALGYSYIDIATQRQDSLNKLKGDRVANQFFGSIELTRRYNYNEIILFPYLALDGSYTNLDSYTEVGPVNSMRFNSQDVKTLAGILGLRLGYIINDSRGNFIPRLHFNYQNEFYSESETNVHYVALPTSSYLRNSYSDSNSSWLGGAGLDYYYRNIIINTTYEYTKLVSWGDNHRFLILGRVYFD